MGVSLYTLAASAPTPSLGSIGAASISSQGFAPATRMSFSDALLKAEPGSPTFSVETHGTPAPAASLPALATPTPTSSPAMADHAKPVGEDEVGLRAASEAVARPEPSVATTPPCEPSRARLYCAYTVSTGDSLSSIAAKFGLTSDGDIPAWELLAHSNRPEIASDDDVLEVGQRIRIPSGNAIIHTVLSAETLSDIGAEYGVSPANISGFAGNRIGDADLLVIGQELLIANPGRLGRPIPPATTSAASEAPRATQPSVPAPAASSGSSRTSALGFSWPASGPLSSYYGSSHPLGIDIDLFASPNTPNLAAAPGTVTFAGGDPCCSYGYYVVIDHGNGYQSLYAHFSKLSVSAGQKVAQGEVLGLAGSTGYSTGNHLHFELRKNGTLVNPLEYLP